MRRYVRLLVRRPVREAKVAIEAVILLGQQWREQQQRELCGHLERLAFRAGRSLRAQQHSQLLRRNAKGAADDSPTRHAGANAGQPCAGWPESVADRCGDAGREGKGSDAQE